MPENTDPKSMTDEELDAALGIEPEPKEEPEVPEPVVETPPAEVTETPVEEPVVPPVEEEEPATPPPSRREQLRINDLLAKYKAPAPTATPEAPAPQTPGLMDYSTAIQADPEIVNQLEADRTAATNAGYQRGLEQSKSLQFHTRLDIDAPIIEAKYPQLDKSSDEFHKPIAAAVNNFFLNMVGYDAQTDTVQRPEIRYKDFVESLYELADEIAGPKLEESKKVIKSQAAKTGLRPDGSGTKKLNLNKTPQAMTDEELDAVIAQAVPSR